MPLKLVHPVIPAFEAAVNRPGNRLAIDGALINRARVKRETHETREKVLTALFDPARSYPGVVPPGHKPPKLAMDNAPLQVAGWAQQWGVNSSLQEGQGFLGYAVLSELAQRPEYRAITETIAYEMVREGVRFKSTGKDDKSERIKCVEKAFKRLDVLGVLAKAASHDGFFGRGHVYLDTGINFEEGVSLSPDDANELKSNLGDGKDLISEAKVSPRNPLRKLINVEPVWTYPTSYNSFNPLAPTWFKPSSWFVMGTQVHSSRLLTFVGREVPDLLKPAYSFGGLSMTQMAMPYVQNWLRTRQAVADLIWSFTVFVLKTNLSESLQVDGEQLFNRAELFNQFRNNQGLMMLDKDMEDFVNVSASLGGLHELQAQAQEHMSAVARIPLVKLFGIQPAGLNASSEGEIRVFYDWIAAYQEHLFRMNLDKIFGFVQLSEFGEVDHELTYEFKGLWQLDEAGEKGVLKTQADIDDAYVAMGAVSAEEIRERLANDPESPYQGLDLSEPLPQPDPMGGGEIDPETGQPIDPDEMIDPSHGEPGGETREQIEQTPGGNLHPKDPGSRLATSMSNKPASIGHPASNGFKGNSFDALIALDATWTENLHPRDDTGKFATHAQSSSGTKKALSELGFKTNKLKAKATWVNGEHKVSVLKPQVGKGSSSAWHHHNTNTSGGSAVSLLQHFAKALGSPAVEKAVNSLLTSTQAPALMTSKFVPSNSSYKVLMDDYGWIPLKQSSTQQTYGLPGTEGTVTIKKLKYGDKYVYKPTKDTHYPVEGKSASSLDHYMSQKQGLSPENKAKLGPLSPPPHLTSHYPQEGSSSLNGASAKTYSKADPKYTWSQDETLTIGQTPNKNEGKWKITKGGSNGNVLASGYGAQELNAAFEALHPRGPGGKFMAKPGTPEFEKELQNKLGNDWQKTFDDGNVFAYEGGQDVLEIVKSDGSWQLSKFDQPNVSGSDLDSLYKAISGKPVVGAPPKSSGPLKLSDLKKVGPQKGSNAGGVYEAENGKRYYVKNLQSEDHVKNERLAASLYKLAGASTLNYVKSDDSKALVTEMQSLSADSVNQLTSAQKKMAQQDFATHAWLANWDAVGLVGDNLGAVGPDERPINLDLGGSLNYRAQGTPKGSAFGDSANEWDTLRDPSKNASAAAFFADMTQDELKASAERLRPLALQGGKMQQAAIDAGYSNEEAYALAQKLKVRLNDVLKRSTPQFNAPFDYKSESSGPGIYQLDKATENVGTSAERAAAKKYTGGSYSEINAALRFGLHEGSEHPEAKTIENLTSWLDKLSMPEETICTRRVTSDYASFLKSIAHKGAVFTDLGFASTSRTGNWYGSLICQVRIPKGAKAGSVHHLSQNPSENEVLIQRGTRYKVVDYDSKTNTLYLDIDQKHLEKL